MRRKSPGRVPLLIIATIATVAALHLARELTMPVALALFFAVVLSPAVERLRRFGLPNGIAAVLVMLTVVGVLAALVNLTIDPARAWFDRAPRLLAEVETKFRPLRQVSVQIDKVAAQAERVTGGTGATAPPAPAPQETNTGLLWKTPAILLPVVAVFFLTLFMLASGPPLLMRLGAARRRTSSMRHVVVVLEHTRRELSRFLGTIALINIGLGTVATLIAYAFDLPTPLLWGVMAAVLNFVPYAGSATTLTALTLVAILTHDSLGPAFGVAVSYLAAATIEGQLVQPLALGRRLALSPLVVFMGLWVWGWIWGIAGLLLATPILLAIKSVSVQTSRWGPLAEFLSPSAAPPITSPARAWRRTRRRRRLEYNQQAFMTGATERESESTLV